MADRTDNEHESDIWDEGETLSSDNADTLESRAQGIWCDLWRATTFLTRLPVPRTLTPPACRDGGDAGVPLAVAARAFPLVGVLVGLAGAAAIGVGFVLGLHPLGLALLCLAAAALVTGALHEDGLADVADGFGGGRDVDAKLAILRDSRIGTYGVLALVFSVGVRAAALMSFLTPLQAAFAFVAAAAISRAGLPVLMYVMAPARDDGLGFSAGRPSLEGVVTAGVLAVLIGFLCAGLWATLVGVALGALAVAGVGWLATRQIGGVTGDVLGATQQVGELVVLVGILWALG